MKLILRADHDRLAEEARELAARGEPFEDRLGVDARMAELGFELP